MAQEQNEIVDVIIEKPISIKISNRKFKIMPFSLGKTLMLSKYNKLLKINGNLIKIAPLQALVDLCGKNENIISQIIAIILTNKKERLLDDYYINDLTAFIEEKTNLTERATIMQLYFEFPTISKYIKMLGIDKEKEKAHKAIKAKEKSSSIQVGGVSIYGNLIDVACNRYKWTYDYVVWGLSYTNLQLLLADAVQDIYLTQKERAKAHISTDGINISGDDPKNIALIKNLLNS